MSQERVKLPAVGGSSLLVIFTVLCLTVFALLGLETVRANCRLTDAAADSVASYYAADAQAESIVALLRTGEIPDYVLQDEDVCTFACTAGDTQALVVSVRIVGDDYEILSWQSVPSAEWQAADSLNVWSGESN